MVRNLALTLVVLIAATIAVGRQYVGIPFVPPSGREIVARLSGLPIPVFAHSEDAVDDCIGIFCKDYYARGRVRLGPAPCAKAIAAAKTQGWGSLPMPIDLKVVQEAGAPPTPHEGYFHLEQKRPGEHTFAWIETTSCQIYAELGIS